MANCFIGRQPIFNRKKEVYAYEILFRSGPQDTAGDIDGDVATSQVVMNTFVEIGIENVVGSRIASFNLTRQFVLNDDLVSFPPEQVMVEIHPDVEVDAEVVQAVRYLNDKGYTIALDGFVYHESLNPLIEVAHVVKLDVQALGLDEISKQLQHFQGRDVLLAAQKVETAAEFQQCFDLGFDYFQGHFLSRPEVVSAQRLPTNKLAVLQLLAKVSDSNTEIEELEELINHDPSLAVRTLRYVNSPISGLTREVDSIRQAVVLLGRDLIKNWVMLLTIANLDDTIPELVTTALVRGHFCQQLAKEANLPGPASFFTVGLFSALDAVMGMSMEELLQDMPFTDEVKQALLEYAGPKGKALQCALELEWGEPTGLGFEPLEWQRVADLHLQALKWADQSSASLG